MSEPFVPSGRYHRVTTKRRNLRVLECPLEPELLVAEFAGELPPEVALAVREHIAVCEICGAKSRALQTPYQVIASLGSEPVPYVPDLRDSVQSRLSRGRTPRRIFRVIGGMGRGGGLVALCVIGALALVGFLLFGIISAGAENLSPSSNQLSGVPAAAPTGVLLAETDKLVTVTGPVGQQWNVAEVIAVDERNGSVLHSLPSSNGPLHPSDPHQLPVATQSSPDGHTVYEVTAPNAFGRQALVAFDSSSGKVLFVTVLALPGQAGLPAHELADTLTVAPDGTQIYVGLGLAQPAVTGSIRVLAYASATGVLDHTLAPAFYTQNIPMPPPPGSLPVSVFPNSVPHLNADGFDVTLGAGGKLAVSPDGQWLFDELLLSQNSSSGAQYVVVRRISVSTGGTTQELAIQGDFTISQLAITGPTAQVPQLYLIKGGADSVVYILDPSAAGPTEAGLIDLGGLVAPGGTTFTGSVTLGPADGTQLYATEKISGDSGAISSQNLWLLDTTTMSVEAQLLGTDAADGILPNPQGGYTGAPFLLRSGEVFLAPDSLQGTVVPWLSLSDGHPIIALLSASQQQ
jgi:hypothetical protein